MVTLILLILSVVIWIFLIKMFHDLKMMAFKFYAGSLGLFFILTFFFRFYLQSGFKRLLFYSLLFLDNLTHLFSITTLSNTLVVANNSIFNINFDTQTSALLSMIVFTSLIWFFPLLRFKKRVALFVLGNLIIFLINIVESFIVIVLVKTFSMYSLTIDFQIIGKLIFFVLIVTLYYFMFTKSQVKNQRVGEL